MSPKNCRATPLPCLGVCAFSGLQDPTCYSCLPDWHPLAHTKLFRLDEELFLFGLSCQVFDWVAGDGYLVKLGSRELGDELLLADDVEGRAWGQHLRVGLVQDQHLRVPERWRKQQLHAVHNHRLLGRRPNHLHRLPCGNSRSDFPLMHWKSITSKYFIHSNCAFASAEDFSLSCLQIKKMHLLQYDGCTNAGKAKADLNRLEHEPGPRASATLFCKRNTSWTWIARVRWNKNEKAMISFRNGCVGQYLLEAIVAHHWTHCRLIKGNDALPIEEKRKSMRHFMRHFFASLYASLGWSVLKCSMRS